MASYWERMAYEADMQAARSQAAGLTPEAPVYFAGWERAPIAGSFGGWWRNDAGVPNADIYTAPQKSASAAPKAKPPKTPKPPKPPKAPKLYSKVFSDEKTYAADGTRTRIARDPSMLNSKGLKKYTSDRLGIKSTYTEPKNTETTVAKSNTGRLRVARGARFMGKSSLVIKKAN
jgi:hypothetical protein